MAYPEGSVVEMENISAIVYCMSMMVQDECYNMCHVIVCPQLCVLCLCVICNLCVILCNIVKYAIRYNTVLNNQALLHIACACYNNYNNTFTGNVHSHAHCM